MTIRHLDDLFDPASVAVIGASDRAGTVGATVWRNLRRSGFAGPTWPVSLRHRQIGGDKAYAHVADLPSAPALAVVCTPPATVPGLVAELGARGTRAVVVMSAGLDAVQRQAMLDAARPYRLRIVGPNSFGVLSPPSALDASFAHAPAPAGGLAFVSQSGALASAMLDWARGRGIGFSRVISLGENADVDFGDLLDWLASDAQTRAVLLYVESLTAARKFMSAARAAARNKPVLLVKAGRSSAGQRAAAQHSGAQPGADPVIDAAIRRAGMLRVETLQDLFVAAETLAYFRAAVRTSNAEALSRLTLVTNGGGAGVLAADAAGRLGLELATLAPATLEALAADLPAHASAGNPVDLAGDAPLARYVHALRTLLATPEAGTLLFIHAPTAIVPALEIAQALVPLAQEQPGRLVSCWLGDAAVAPARQLFHAAGIPTYDTPEQAVHALAMLVAYRRHQDMLMEAPDGHPPPAPFDLDGVRRVVDGALAAGRSELDGPEARALLAACGIAVPAARDVAPTPEAAAAAASALGFPVQLELVAPRILHKADVGGFLSDLDNAEQVAQAAAAMLERAAERRPDAPVHGLRLQPVLHRPQALELIVGTHIDPLFGPVIRFGAGGSSVEVVDDSAYALPPLSEPLARALVARTRVARLLAGWRDVPPADAGALHRALIALAQLLAEEPRIVELDVNPLLADGAGVLALDARVRVSAAAPGGAARFAIRPYPSELIESFIWDYQGQPRTVTLRPIRPEDEAQHLAFLQRMDPEDVRLRIFYSRRSIERSELARLTQIDYEREMAFIATWQPERDSEETLAVVRTLTDPDNVESEFGVMVRSDLKGSGLGWRLMDKLIAYLRGRGTQRLVATVLPENHRMLALAAAMGMHASANQPDADTHRLEMALQPGHAPPAVAETLLLAAGPLTYPAPAAAAHGDPT